MVHPNDGVFKFVNEPEEPYESRGSRTLPWEGRGEISRPDPDYRSLQSGILRKVLKETIMRQTIIFICGLYSISFAVFHIAFWKIFHWDTDLNKLSFANKAIMQLLNVQLIYFFVFVSFLCFVFPKELSSSDLGKCFMLGISVFWIIRTIQQFIFLRANYYKIHLLTVIFFIGAILFVLPFFI